jgi:iron complex outermembrane receptor protein
MRAAGCLLCSLALSGAVAGAGPADPPAGRDLTELSLEELASLEVTTVRRKPEPLARTPAALFVITRQELRRAGATTLAEALRLVPGVLALRQDAGKWATGIRGVPARLSRGILVLIDGRSVYTPLFAGTYWEEQDTLLEDVERIEVIRGPGGTLWGANAVNGVVNVITRRAGDTQGGFASATAVSETRAFDGRWGGSAGDRGHYRVYGKASDTDASFHSDGADFDGWWMARGGFRGDWDRTDGAFTLTGEGYAGHFGQRTTYAVYQPPFSVTADDPARLGGGHLLGRWQRRLGGGGLDAVVYYDHTHRAEPSFAEDRDTGNLDVQYRRALPGRQEATWGLGYRVSRGATSGQPTVAFEPPTRTDHIWSAFVQDEVAVAQDLLSLTVGAKVERNGYSGFEVQPSARALWTPHPRHAAWGAVSRAVRTPSRVERDLDLTVSVDARQPVFARVRGDAGFSSESVVAYEAGYRYRAGTVLSLDAAAFYNDFMDVLSFEPETAVREPGRIVLPYRIANGLEGRSTGFEVAADVRPRTEWRFQGSYTFLDVDFRVKPQSLDTTQEAAEDAVPRHQLVLRGSYTFTSAVEVDALFRRISAFPGGQVEGHSTLLVRVAWRPRPALELSVTGEDLLQAHHLEMPNAPETQRSVRAGLTWRF